MALVSIWGAISLINSLLGISILLPPSLPTMWFFTMLMLFYLITPLLMWKYKYPQMKFIIALSLVIIAYMLSYYKISDERLGLYLPLYVAGLYVPNNVTDKITSKKYALPITIIYIFLLFNYELVDFSLLFAFGGTIAILYISKIIHFQYFDKIIETLA